MRPAGDLAAGVHALQRRLGVGADRQAAVLVVEHGVGQDRLLERVDAGAAVAAEHVRQRDLGVVGRDPRRVEVDGGAAVLGLDALAVLDLVEDRLADDVARAERVGELLAGRRSGARRRTRASSPGSSSPASSPATRRRSGGTGARPGRAPRRRGRARSASPRRSRSDGWSRARRAPPRPGSSGRRRRGSRSPRRARARRRSRASRSRPARAPTEGCSGNRVPPPASNASRSAFVIACPVRSPTWSSRLADAPPQRASR